MRTIFAMCAAILVIGGLFVWRATQLPNEFGEFTGANEVAVEDIVARPQDFKGKMLLVRGTVREQCQSMGCYFFLPARNGKLRVELEEVAMNAPMHEGRPARVEGQIVPYSEGYQLYASAVAFE
jgi:hypothetical protein